MKVSGLRWLMIGLVFLATVINYIDRQTVSVLKTAISEDLHLRRDFRAKEIPHGERAGIAHAIFRWSALNTKVSSIRPTG